MSTYETNYPYWRNYGCVKGKIGSRVVTVWWDAGRSL